MVTLSLGEQRIGDVLKVAPTFYQEDDVLVRHPDVHLTLAPGPPEMFGRLSRACFENELLRGFRLEIPASDDAPFCDAFGFDARVAGIGHGFMDAGAVVSLSLRPEGRVEHLYTLLSDAPAE